MGNGSGVSAATANATVVTVLGMDDVQIRDDVIRLGQFLKLASLIENGADAKAVIGDGLVQVNGEVEVRRGRQLQPGDVVEFEGHQVRVARNPR